MKLTLSRILSAFLMAGGWLLAGARTVLDLIGYSTAPEDVAVASARLDQFFEWLLSVPWWAVWGFALISTLWLIWVSWPRRISPLVRAESDHRDSGHDMEAARQSELASADPMDATEGDMNERLELFIIEFVAPACWAQIDMQKAILREMCADARVLRFAERGLLHDHVHWQFCENFEKVSELGGSPMPDMTNREMVDCIVKLETDSYRKFCDQTNELTHEAGFDHRCHTVVGPLWEDWRLKHNALVEEFDRLKRESRFGRPLYRPQKPSRWGGLVSPVNV